MKRLKDEEKDVLIKKLASLQKQYDELKAEKEREDVEKNKPIIQKCLNDITAFLFAQKEKEKKTVGINKIKK